MGSNKPVKGRQCLEDSELKSCGISTRALGSNRQWFVEKFDGALTWTGLTDRARCRGDCKLGPAPRIPSTASACIVVFCTVLLSTGKADARPQRSLLFSF